jgi:hypothetical protein
MRVVLEDDNGNAISESAERVYSLSGPCDNLDQIEYAVEQVKRSMLPDVERALLELAQKRLVEAKKNSGVPPKREKSRQD